MFSVISLDGEEYDYVVIMNTQVELEDIMGDIECDLKYMCNGRCSIVFDLLLLRGDSGARFLETIFDGEKLDKGLFRSVNIKKKSNIRKVTSNYFRENRDLLWDSELSDYQRQLIIRGDFL